MQSVWCTWFWEKNCFYALKAMWFRLSRPLPRIWFGMVWLKDGKSNVSINSHSGTQEKSNVCLLTCLAPEKNMRICKSVWPCEEISLFITWRRLGQVDGALAFPLSGAWFLQRCSWLSPPLLGDKCPDEDLLREAFSVWKSHCLDIVSHCIMYGFFVSLLTKSLRMGACHCCVLRT